MFFEENLLIFLAILIGGIMIGVFSVVFSNIKQRKIELDWQEKNIEIQNRIYSGHFIYFEDFERDWISLWNGNTGVAGYRYSDGCGCYVITVYSYPVLDGNFMNYENIYIGQSVNICQRVHNHFTGKGKGDIYADIKYGKYVYVQFVPCDASYMNTMEKELIQAFDATSSYNRTRGGGRNRNMQGWY